MTVDSIWLIVAALLVAFIVGAAIGATVAIAIYDRATERAARLARTGNPAKPSKQPGETAVPGGEFQGVSIEREAQERAYRNVIENGARQIMELEPALTLEQARAKAKRALDELGAFAKGATGA